MTVIDTKYDAELHTVRFVNLSNKYFTIRTTKPNHFIDYNVDLKYK